MAQPGDIAGGLFHFPAALPRDPAVEAWFGSQQPELAAIALEWFGEMRRAGPDVRELIHDACPVACVGEVAYGYVNAFASHVNVGFFQGAGLDDPASLLHGEGKRMRHAKLRPGFPLDAAALRRLIEDAYLDVKRKIDTRG